MKTAFLFLLLIAGCKNFYDDADDDEETYEVILDNVQYGATLSSPDANVSTIAGDATVDVQGNVITVNVNLSGVPQNTTRLHYAYMSANCSALNNAGVLPNDTSGTRSIEINETMSLAALQNDVASSGAASFEGDANLANKSFIVKAFSTAPDQFNNGGTASMTIACGPLNITGEASLE